MAFTGTDVMSSQQYLDKLTEFNSLTLTKGRLYYIGDTKAIALATATDEYIPLYENAIGSDLAFTAATSKITYKTPFGVEKELSLADLHAATATTATKLKNKRKIWGVDFDGTAPVSGPFSGATTGAFSKDVTVGGHLKVGSADGSYVQIGALRLVYDAANKAIKLIDPNTTTPANANFYATGSVAAYGPGTISGGGSAVSILDDWTGYEDNMSTWALSAGLGHDLLLSKASLASPTFTGTPKAPTAASTTKTDQIATTAFVHNVVTTALTSVFSYKGTATVESINDRGNGSTPVGSAFRLSSSGEITKAVDSDKYAAIGDMVICTQLNPIQWSILQNNIDTVDLESRLDTVETLLTWILPTT